MTGPRLLLGAVVVLSALLAQTVLPSVLSLPGGPPPLLTVVVLAFALAEGSPSGAVTGFVAGLSADLVSDHDLGRQALALAVVGHLAGRAADGSRRARLLTLAVVAAGVLGAVLLFAVEGLLLGDPRVDAATVLSTGWSALAYGVVLTPLVVPLVRSLTRRVDADGPRGRRRP